MNSKNFAAVLIVVLAITAVGLGYLIFQQSAGKKSTSPISNSSKNPILEKDKSSSVAPESQDTLLNSLPKTATKEQKDARLKAITELAKEADFIDISSCDKISPVVLKTQLKKDITFKNSDSVAHTINLFGDLKYDIATGATQTVAGDFQKGTGYYGYTCDKKPGLAGYLLVTP